MGCQNTGKALLSPYIRPAQAILGCNDDHQLFANITPQLETYPDFLRGLLGSSLAVDGHGVDPSTHRSVPTEPAEPHLTRSSTEPDLPSSGRAMSTCSRHWRPLQTPFVEVYLMCSNIRPRMSGSSEILSTHLPLPCRTTLHRQH